MSAVYARTRNFQDQCFPFIDVLASEIRVRKGFVYFEKDEARRQRSALVADLEGMVAAEIEQIGSGDIDHVFDQCFSAISSLRRRDPGFEQSSVAQARHAAVRGQDFPVNRFHRGDREEP